MLISGNYGSMTSISIPERVVFNDKFHYVTYIGDGAFKNCKNITAIVFPKRLEEIGVSAFEGAKISVSDLSFPTTLTKIHDSAFNGTTGISSVSLPEKVEYIGNSAFAGSSIRKINLPVAPGTGCFKYATNLTTVTFAEKVDTIADEVFYGCTKLANIALPQSLTKIGSSAFSGCTGLTEIAFNAGLAEIGSSAFYGCTGLTEVAFNAGLAEIGTSAFSGCTGLTEINLPESLQNIGNYAFENCSSLTKAYVTASVPEQCFSSDSKLTEVTLTEGVYSVGDKAFENCSALETITISNSVESIGQSAFNGCSGLAVVTIPNSVESIGASAFSGCSKLTDITIADGASAIELDKTSLGTAVTNLYMGRDWNVSLNSLSKLESLILGNTVTAIPDYAFSGCSNLSAVKFGSSVETIGADAFNGCKLTELVLSPATQTIGANAFKGNSLKTIALGANVKEIGGYAFDGSNALTGVSITALTPPAAENTTFSYYDCPLYVSPSANDAVKDAYYNFTRCWYRFTGYDLIPIAELKVEGNATLNLQPGESTKLTATFSPADASLPYIFWRSTNPDVATVDKDGNVTMVANGGANTRAAETQTCEIIAETLYADGPVATVTVTADASAVEDLMVDEPAVSPARSNDIYTLQGVCVKRNATEEDVKALTPGLYIIGGKKVLVK